MNWWVYIIKSEKSGKYYVGYTESLERRLHEHNKGKNKSTRNKGPWVIAYTEEYKTKVEARRRELIIKSYKGGNAFKKLVSG